MHVILDSAFHVIADERGKMIFLIQTIQKQKFGQPYYYFFYLSMAKSPTKPSGGKPLKAASPGRRKGKPVSLKEKLLNSSKAVPTLEVYAMHHVTNLELYLFQVGKGRDGFLYGFKDYSEGKKICAPLEDANFTGLWNRRDIDSVNDIMKDDKGYFRKVIVRHPAEGSSTPETRAEGLRVLKEVLLTKVLSEYPPETIDTFDATREEDPHAMDLFLQDKDIIDVVKKQIDEEDLNTSFYVNFTDCAKKLWSGNNVPAFAREQLGFP